MYTITIDNYHTDWLYPDQWKVEVSGDQDFDNKVVIICDGHNSHEKAYWWKKAKEISKDLDCYLDNDGFRETYKDQYSEQQVEALIKNYEDWDGNREIDYLVRILGIIYPNIEFEYEQIRGNVQRDYADAIYIKDSINDVRLAEFYFGNVTEVRLLEDGEIVDSRVFTDSEFWEYEKGDLKKNLKEEFGIPEGEPVTVTKFNGYVQTESWSEVE